MLADKRFTDQPKPDAGFSDDLPLSDSDLTDINCYAQAVGDADYLEFYHDDISIDLALARLMRDLADGGAK